MERLWNALKGSKKDSNHELNRSTYSLVSCGEVTPDTLQLWVGLPEEVKYDPELEKFRRMYEEIGNSELRPKNQKNGSEVRAKRLPLVYSAPLLDGKDHAWTEEKTTNDGTNNDGGTAIQNLELTDDVRVQPASGLQTKINAAKYYSKMTLLLGCWVFFTAVFLMYNEKKEVYKNTAIPPAEVKNYTINASEIDSILVRISGPFLSEQAEIKMNSSEIETKERLIVWLEKWPMTDNNSMLIKKIILQDQDLDFNEGEPRALKFEFGRSTNETVYAVHMRTTTNRTVAFSMSLSSDPLDVSTGVIYACVLLSGLYVLIIFEVINRTMAAIIVSTTSIAALALVGERPSLPELVSWLDVETLLLLFSMMLLVAIMAETGIFDYLAVFTFEVTRGKLWPLIFLLCTITAVLSTFLDNVTTVLLMSPVTIRLCEVMDLDPVPILMFMAIYSNIGGCATPVGDPPNVIVASNKAVIQAVNRVSLSWTALIGATLLLILADREDLEPVLHRVEWSTLLFFAALFVLMEALSKLGLILYIGGLMEQLILKVDESARLAAALMLILWVSGMISAFVDNIPLTTMMVRVVVSIGSNPNLNLPMAPLIWALLFGACLGGNGTLIGASANVVCAGVAEQHGYRFTFMHFFRVGFPVMIGHLLVSSIYLLICHCVFAWH